jgi:5'-nucleotidase
MITKRVLLTGDDGYNAIGTRLLIDLLKDEFDLVVVGTKNQQSGVGGMVNVKTGGEYGETVIDGIKAYWVDGSPVDAVLFARTVFNRPFDLTISGMNLGINVGSDILSSGTFSAAQRAVAQHLSPAAIALSYDVPASNYHKDHSGVDDLEIYKEYPGKYIKKLLLSAVAQNYWGADLVNINFPFKPTTQARFASVLVDSYNFWPPVAVDANTKRFTYPSFNPTDQAQDMNIDSTVVAKGYISISPINLDLTDAKVLKKIIGTNKTITV